MHVAIIGAAGMIGHKLAEQIAENGMIGRQPVDTLTLVDVIAPVVAENFRGRQMAFEADLSSHDAARQILEYRPGIVIHLAAVVSAEAEEDFEKGYRVNLDGTRALFDAIRAVGNYKPRIVYASSLAVFGAPFPAKIDDDFHLTPLTSYGAQKAIGELLLDDYSRRGFFDGVGVRFPTICIRPGTPNKAASSFFSSILREPLHGQNAILPVNDNVRHWFASPRAALGYITHASTMDTSRLGERRNLTMPGVSATVGDQIKALRDVAGDEAASLIQRIPDPAVAEIVAGWPLDFDTARALEMGFRAESSFKEILEVYIEDEMGGALPVATPLQGSN